MSFPAETGWDGKNCISCKKGPLNMEVLRSNAGYYLGTFCPECGPHSRESGYFPSYEEAEKALSGMKGNN